MSSTRRSERRVEGPASNGQQRSSNRAGAIGAAVVRATTISFTGPDTIADSGNGLAGFVVGALIRVQGSDRNSREYVVLTSAAGTLTVRAGRITTEAAGPVVEIRRLG